MIGINVDKGIFIETLYNGFNVSTIGREFILLFANELHIIIIFFVCDNKQFNFFILLRKFLRIDQLIICNHEQILRPNLIRY